MTLMLRNNSKKSSLTLRYGDGLNKAIQIAPGQDVDFPLEMSKGLIKSYLTLFPNLEVVDSSKEVKKAVETKDENKNENKDDSQNTQDDNNNENKDNANDQQTGSEGDKDNTKNESDEAGQSDEDKSKDPDDKKEGSADENSDEVDTNNENKKKIYTAAQLKNMSADQVKEIAISYGIDVEAQETNTKKEQMAIILNKQQELDGNK